MMALLKLRLVPGALRWLVALVVSGVFALTASAQAGGEEVTSLPFTEDSSGLTFVGTVRDIRAILLDTEGRGTISVHRVPRGLVAVTLIGAYHVELDRAALARSNVQILFHGGAIYQGGYARLTIGDSTPVLLSPERVPLPLGRLAATTRLQGRQLVLDVFGERAQHAHIDANFSLDRVTLLQRE